MPLLLISYSSTSLAHRFDFHIHYRLEGIKNSVRCLTTSITIKTVRCRDNCDSSPNPKESRPNSHQCSSFAMGKFSKYYLAIDLLLMILIMEPCLLRSYKHAWWSKTFCSLFKSCFSNHHDNTNQLDIFQLIEYLQRSFYLLNHCHLEYQENLIVQVEYY